VLLAHLLLIPPVSASARLFFQRTVMRPNALAPDGPSGGRAPAKPTGGATTEGTSIAIVESDYMRFIPDPPGSGRHERMRLRTTSHEGQPLCVSGGFRKFVTTGQIIRTAGQTPPRSSTSFFPYRIPGRGVTALRKKCAP